MASSLDDEHTQAGAQRGEWRGQQVILSFGQPDAEYTALTTGVGLIDLSTWTRLHLTGKDRARYLHGMVTNDVQGLKPGQGCYATVVTAQGKTLSDIIILALDEMLLLYLPPQNAERVLQHLDFYLIADRAEFENITTTTTCLSLQGPGAATLLDLPTLPTSPFHHLQTQVGSLSVRVVMTQHTPAGGFDLIVNTEDGPALWAWLVERGAVPVGHQVMDILHVEGCLPWTGPELNEEVIPMEAGLEERAISFNKGCYLGQEVMAKIKYRGRVQRNLRRLQLSDGDVVPGARILHGEDDAGWITSVVNSPRLGLLALGYVKIRAEESGGPLTVGEHTRVTLLPLQGTAQQV